jgi:2-amino-4-hydroxy-6-hydroxymethyldihydropteridine diphosphokinase
MAIVYLALGSNIGDRERNLQEAVQLLGESGVQAGKMSSIYETEPVDFLDQPWFLNAVLEAETQLSPVQLLAALRSIESRMGSKKAFAKGPRLIDLDILLFDDVRMETPELQIPHPRMLQRNFVLVPLVEIAPALRHPVWPKSAAELLASSNDPSLVRKFAL